MTFDISNKDSEYNYDQIVSIGKHDDLLLDSPKSKSSIKDSFIYFDE